MTETAETETVVQPAPLRISRLLHAPRETVFKAWSTAEHVKQWFPPRHYTAPDAKVEMRVGGAFEVCMRAPDGQEHWSRGSFVEVRPLERLVIDMQAVDDEGRPLFRAYTEVDFSDALCGTQVDVVQTYTVFNAAVATPMIGGAPIGWGQTLDKLDAEVVRMQGGGDVNRSVTHATFHLERTYDATVEQVFTALADETARRKWFAGGEGRWELVERYMDFRVGGRERLQGRWESGLVSTFDAVYHDIIPGERIVYTYEMHMDDRKISVSLATLQLKAEGESRTTLLVTEQGAYLDGYDDAGSREHGTGLLLDALGASLKT